jgi:hypothetical protein
VQAYVVLVPLCPGQGALGLLDGIVFPSLDFGVGDGVAAGLGDGDGLEALGRVRVKGRAEGRRGRVRLGWEVGRGGETSAAT